MMGEFRTAVTAVVCIGVLAAGGFGGVAGAAGNEAPLADAGLDRDVAVNATVYLDATGSRDPDGSIADYEWSVEAPDGDQTAPDCRTCGETEFVVREPGQYNVTVTVTDDDGAERSDTLYVTVSEVDGPAVSVSGPTSVTAYTANDYTATLSAGDEDLSRVDWEVDGEQRQRENVDGETATDSETLTMEEGTHTLKVTVYDELGRTASETLTVDVQAPPESADPDENGPEGSNTGGDFDSESACQYSDEGPNQNDCSVDSVIDAADGSVTIYDTDGDGVIQVNNETFEDLDGASPTVTIEVEDWNEHVHRSQMGDEGLGEIHMSAGNGEDSGTIIGSSVGESTSNSEDDPQGGLVEDDESGIINRNIGNPFDQFISGSTGGSIEENDEDGDDPRDDPHIPDKYTKYGKINA